MLQGFEKLDRRLKNLAQPGKIKPLARNAIRAGQRVVVAGIKAQIPPRYRDARKAIGSTLKRSRVLEDGGSVAAKVGAGVGKKTRSEVKGRTRSGVGIGPRNIHWFILGTKRMAPPLAGCVQRGLAASGADAAAKIKQNLASGIDKLAHS